MTTEQELENIKICIYNLDFIEEDGNNDLILSVRLKNTDHTSKIYNLDTSVINKTNNNRDNFLIESLRYSNYSKAKFLILNTSINILHK